MVLSSSSSAASVPNTVTVPAGQASVTFSVTTSSVTSSQSVAVTATFNGASQAASLTINAAPVTVSLSSLTLTPTTVIGGFGAIGAVRLSSPAQSGGAVVTLQSSGSAASVPASVTASAGSSVVGFTITTGAVTTSQTITITASLRSSYQRSAILTVNPPAQTLPDLVITSVTFPSSATTGSAQTFTAVVQNNGTGAAGAFRVGLYYSTDLTITIGDTRVGTCSVGGLAAGASTSCSGPLTVPDDTECWHVLGRRDCRRPEPDCREQ